MWLYYLEFITRKYNEYLLYIHVVAKITIRSHDLQVAFLCVKTGITLLGNLS